VSIFFRPTEARTRSAVTEGMNSPVELEAIDFAVEDLLRVEVSYGRLRLLLRALTDRVRGQTETLANLREDHVLLLQSHTRLKRQFDGRGVLADVALAQDDARHNDEDDVADLQGQLAKLREDLRALTTRVSFAERPPYPSIHPHPHSPPIHQQHPVDPPRSAIPGERTAPEPKPQDGLTDALLEDHHRRLSQLEESQRAEITDLVVRAGVPRPPSAASQAREGDIGGQGLALSASDIPHTVIPESGGAPIYGRPHSSSLTASSPRPTSRGPSDPRRALAEEHEARLRLLETAFHVSLRPSTASGDPQPPTALQELRDAANLTNEAVAEMVQRLSAVEERCNATAAADDVRELQTRLDTKYTELADQLQMLPGLSTALYQCEGAVQQLTAAAGGSEGLAALRREVDDSGRRVREAEVGKAGRPELVQVTQRVNQLEAALHPLVAKLEAAQRVSVARPLVTGTGTGNTEPGDDLRIAVATHATLLDGVLADKADREAVERLTQDVLDLRALVDDARSYRPLSGAGRPHSGGGGVPGPGPASPGPGGAVGGPVSGGSGSGGGSPAPERRPTPNPDSICDRAWVESRLGAVHAALRSILDAKADGSLLATKAEREYVEHSLDRLRRDMESAIKDTNASLIDTLDRSLGLLRDMVACKADQAELLDLRGTVSREPARGGEAAAEGLAAYKSYRCLSCNRNLETVRPRPNGMSFNSFMSHLPNVRSTSKFGASSLRAATIPDDLILPPISPDRRTLASPTALSPPDA